MIELCILQLGIVSLEKDFSKNNYKSIMIHFLIS
jgi:hypothetical protein